LPVSVDLSKYLEEEYTAQSLPDILAAPLTALSGVTEDDAEALKRAFRIRTVGDLGRNKYFLTAQALAQLGK
jgi:hypothetical protein